MGGGGEGGGGGGGGGGGWCGLCGRATRTPSETTMVFVITKVQREFSNSVSFDDHVFQITKGDYNKTKRSIP
jgi:hypothetical protein